MVIGTRGSLLARTQTGMVADALRTAQPDLEIEIRTIRTEGDVKADRPLAEIGGKGVFVKELERALLRGQIDLAVHSLKDVPALIEDGLKLQPVLARADARDVLISRDRKTLQELRGRAVIATGSERRSVQLLAMRPDITTVPIRGNVDTRLRKLDAGEFDALVLAAAGIERLGRGERITHYFDVDVMIPSPGQGTLAVELRAGSPFCDLVKSLEHTPTATAVAAERAFLHRLGAGCELPVGAHAVLRGDEIFLNAMIGRPDGTVSRSSGSSPVAAAAKLGHRVADELLARTGEVASR